MQARELTFGEKTYAVYGRAGDPYFEKIRLDDPTNHFFQFALRRYAPQTMVDVGANIGVTSLIAALSTERVIAFEPLADPFDCLCATIRANNLTNVEPIRAAVGASAGEVSFFSSSRSTAANHIVTADTLSHGVDVTTPMLSLDDFTDQRELSRVDFLKIDVEGFEIDVLTGAAKTIEKYQPTALVEFNSFTMIAFRNLNPRDLLTMLRRTFPYVYRWQNGAPLRIGTDVEALAFIHQHLTGAGCVDDLLCAFQPAE